MNLSAWPALKSYSSTSSTVVYQRAVFGKVTGQRSDYRWIGRTPDFEGHLWDIQRKLSIGFEDDPRQAFFWHVDEAHRRGYAVFCYPSVARDATGRSGSLEKQILEFKLDSPSETAFAALVLLKEATSKDASEWVGHAADTRWLDPNFCLPLKETRKRVTALELEAAVETGLSDLALVEPDALKNFYLGLIQRHGASRSPAFLQVQRELSPEALAVLLLPLGKQEVEGTSLAGGLPARMVEEAELGLWSGVACQQGQVRNLSQPVGNFEKQALAEMMASSIRERMYPRTAPLLEFALSEDRWSDPLLPEDSTPITNSEISIVTKALNIVANLAKDDPFIDHDQRIADARRRHLNAKLAVILAIAHKGFDLSGRQPDDDLANLVTQVQDIWDRRPAGSR